LETFKSFSPKLYTINERIFPDIALEVFRFQSVNNPVYAAFLRNLSVDASKVNSISEIPFLPISFFKSQTLKTGDWEPETFFSSSGTTGSTTSKHAVQSLDFYLDHAQKCFEYFFGPVSDYHFLALLPSYLEREGSSLVAMINHFIRQSKSSFSGFYLQNTDQLLRDIDGLRHDSRKTIVWGVSFALLDLIEKSDVDLSHGMVFETGGMKGRRKEITRADLHAQLGKRLHVDHIYSEYGMTELLSQAYTQGTQRFACPPWMKVIGREVTDPFSKGLLGETAGINVVDLANWSTISFIETEDLGKVYSDGTFEILGRIDNSDIRGCNLMIE
jgi:hypothetical protein